jgi:predicted TIM-barrel fold metal-dependent hydrolase
MQFIDAHHHLWDLGRVEYPWLMARGEPRFFGQPDPIRKNYLVKDFMADADGRVVKSVHVQVGASPHQELLETAFVTDCSRESQGHFPAAAVAALDMGQQDIRRDLDERLAFPIVRGVRHMIGKSPEENPSLPPFLPERWVTNWGVLAERDVPFDLQLTEDQFDMVLQALRQVPDLRFAICHLASPWDRSPEGFRRWRTAMRSFAALPGAVMKISGFSMFSWKWQPAEFRQWAEAALEIFGARRCMLGSNFPVDRLYVSYGELFEAWESLVGACSPSEARWLAAGTAAEFYRI